MPYSLRIEGLLAKLETTYGTDPTPTVGDNGLRGVGRVWTAAGMEWAFDNTREDTVSGSLVGVAPAAPKGRLVNIDYRVPMIGAGAAYSSSTPVRPPCDPLLMACGFARTHDDTGAAEKVTYDLADTGHASVTVWLYAGGKLIKAVGCRGDVTFAPNAGTVGEIQFSLQGIVVDTPTEVSLPAITYASVVPPPATSMGLAIVPNGGTSWTPRAPQFTVTTGNEISRLDDVNSAQGIEQFAIAGMDPRCTFQARTPDLADYPMYTLAEARTVQTIDATLGTVQYNRLRLDVDLAYLLNPPANAEDQGFAATSFEFMLRDLQLEFD